MSYLITDQHHVLKFTLQTNTTTTLYLRTYVNGNTTVKKTYVGSSTSNGLQFSIPYSDYTINDTITKFELVSSNNTPLYKTNEGVVVLLDGMEIPVGKVTTSNGSDTLVKNNGVMVTEDKLSNTKFYLNFSNAGEHDIQAVYRGNDNICMAMTDKVHFKVSQPVLDENGSLENNGKYVLAFRDANLPTLKYNDGTKIYFRLTKGGVPVPNRTIQRVYPDGRVNTAGTSAKGLVYTKNTGFKAGKYKIGAYFFDEQRNKVITSDYRDIEILKATPEITDNFEDEGEFVKGSNYVAYLKYQGKPLANRKIIIQVNKSKLNFTTSDKGAVAYNFKTKGTFKMKVIFAGDDNFEKVEKSRTVTIKGK